MRARTLLIGIMFALAAPATAVAQGSAAIAVVQNEARADLCRATLDFSRAQASYTPYQFVTGARPVGWDVTVPGTSDPVGGGASFESRWLVTGGYAYPQNIAAARLRTGCAPTTYTPKTALQWHALTYLDPDSGQIAAWSNSGWSGAVRVPGFYPRVWRNNVDVEEGMVAWARSCAAGKQTARFTRTLWLLGVPQSLSVAVDGFYKGLSAWPFSSITVRLNGTVIARQTRPGYLETSLDMSQLRLVDAGDNQLDIRVAKRRTGSCNGGSRRQLGVLFSVVGQHAWVVRVTRPAQQTTNSSNGLPTVPFTVTNYGPSTLLEPRFHFYVVYDQDVKAIGPRVDGNANCTTTPEQFAVVCGADPLNPGQSVTFPVTFYAVPKDYDAQENRFPYTVKFTEWWDGSIFDDGLANGSFCGGGQTNCPGSGA